MNYKLILFGVIAVLAVIFFWPFVGPFFVSLFDLIFVSAFLFLFVGLGEITGPVIIIAIGFGIFKAYESIQDARKSKKENARNKEL